MVLDGVERVPTVKAPADTGLVRHHHNRDRAYVGLGHCLGDPIDENNIVDGVEIMSLLDHNTVSIEE